MPEFTEVVGAMMARPLFAVVVICGLTSMACDDPRTNSAQPFAVQSATPSSSSSLEPTTPIFGSQQEQGRWTMTQLDNIFNAEPRDNTWAGAREKEINETRSNKRLAGVESLQAECRASLCRVVIALEPTNARRTLHALTVTPPLNTSGFHGVDPDDAKKIRMYVGKEGTPLMEHPRLVEAIKRKRG